MTKRAVHKTKKTTSVEKLSLNDRLALLSLISEGVRQALPDSPVAADLFSDLGDLVDATISGAKIDRFKSHDSNNGFQVFEINAETGENLGRLNMLYLKKPIPCYYLVYVEIAAPFRRKGLGNKILIAFRNFLNEKAAVGILDNIIPPDDPTYDIYSKLNWRSVEEITGVPSVSGEGLYMVYIPESVAGRDLRDQILRLVYHLKRKRAAIDMRDNELMVKRTIDEFKDIYSALRNYFEFQIHQRENDPLMRYMFTRFVTKLLGFRRRIAELVGYTGGESLEQIVLDPQVRELPVKSYAPRELATHPSFVAGDRELWLHLPESLKINPARFIESLPNYRRPNLIAWMESKGLQSCDTLTIGDLLDLGFDPTRLKEITIDDRQYIFERMQPRMLPYLEKKKAVLERITPVVAGTRVKNAALNVNPPLLVIKDRGNAYVLRRKIDGIHWEEAVEQLQTSVGLKGLNSSMSVDKLILSTVRKAQDWLKPHLDQDNENLIDQFTFFVSWNMDANQPKLLVDMGGASIDSVWIA